MKIKLIRGLKKLFAWTMILQMSLSMLPVSMASAAVISAFPSTNEINKTKGWAHVNEVSSSFGAVTLDFVNPRSFYSCFEYRTDGDVSQKLNDNNHNTEITDGLYPSLCQNNNQRTKTFNAKNYVEIRLSFGGERDERFDWTRFEVGKDTKKPSASVVSPLQGQSFNGPVEIAINASDDESGIASVAMHIYRLGLMETLVPGCTSLNATYDEINWKLVINNAGRCKLVDDGDYRIKAWAKDSAGNITWPSTRVFRIDTVRPTLKVTKPVSDAVLNGRVNISVEAQDADSDIASASMHVYQVFDSGNKLVRGCTSIPTVFDGAAWNVVINDGGRCKLINDGVYQIAAWAVDTAGNPGWAARTNFEIDTVAPIVNLDSPEAGLVKGKVDIRGTVKDANPHHYWFVVEGPLGLVGLAPYKTGTINEGNSFENQLLAEWDTKKGDDGNYTIRLEARDAAGNKDAASMKKVTVTVDNTAPAKPTLVSPMNESKVQGKLLVNDWESTESDIDYYVYESYHDAQLKKLRWRGDFSESEKSATNVKDTVFWWRVKAVDKAGNESEWSDAWKVTVDNTPPLITLLGGATIYHELGVPYIDAGATAYDNYDGDLTSKIIVTNNVVTGVAGTYDVRYNVTDTNSNEAVEVVRWVTVNSAPMLPTASVPTGTPLAAQTVAEEPEVLGTEDKKEVAGVEDQNNQDAVVDGSQQCKLWFGICWYWFLFIAALALGGGAWYTIEHKKSNKLR